MQSADNASLGKQAARGLGWSIVQNWGGRLVTIAIFIVLARLLSPTEYGTAAAAVLVVTFIGVVAEFGFGDAIIQRRGLGPSDINLPFYLSVGASIGLSTALYGLSGHMESWLRAPGLSPVLASLCFLPPILTISSYQEVLHKRELGFRKLAYRTLVANISGGVSAVLAATQGAGVWSIVIQSYITAVVSAALLWWNPSWRPNISLVPSSFRSLSIFAAPIVTMRIVDFLATRYVDGIIIHSFGLAAFGFYAVGSRLYQILLQLLQTVLNDISLPLLSRIAAERERVAQIYLNTITTSASIVAPLFVLCAAVSHEISLLLFGGQWQGVESIAQPLLLLGAVQSIQNLNGPYMVARGKPRVTFYLVLLKSGLLVLGLSFYRPLDVTDLVYLVVILQLLVSPLSFYLLARELSLSIGTLAREVAPSACGCALAYATASYIRGELSSLQFGILFDGVVISAAFLITYSVFLAAVARRQLVAIFRIYLRHLGKGEKSATETQD